jgi:SAM-dependent methyltransferase
MSRLAPKSPKSVAHWERQRAEADAVFARGSRPHVSDQNPLVRYLVRWRILTGIQRMTSALEGRLAAQASFLVLCAGEGLEGSILADLGYQDVTVSDISEHGVRAATERDKRLKGLVANLEHSDIPDASYDVVIVQDALHHLQNPVLGFTEMLRIARHGAMFFEPHRSLVGAAIGRKWERNGEAVNYVFRWSRAMIQDVASSYLGPGGFTNLSFSYWHHNLALNKAGRLLGGGSAGMLAVRALKITLNGLLGRAGNQVCGMIIKR